MMELENHHFTAIRIITDSGESLQWMLKLVGASLRSNRIFVSKYLPQDTYPSQRENRKITVEKAGRHPLH